jgi:hypothetical protein
MSAQLTYEAPPARIAEPTAPASLGWLAGRGTGVRAALQEMNYGTRRLMEVQAPWTVDPQWHRR